MNEEAEALKAEGNALVAKKDWRAAAKKYKKATDLDPSNPIYWSNLAAMYEKMGSLDEFKEAALRCVAADPSFIKGVYRLAKAHSLLWVGSLFCNSLIVVIIILLSSHHLLSHIVSQFNRV